MHNLKPMAILTVRFQILIYHLDKGKSHIDIHIE